MKRTQIFFIQSLLKQVSKKVLIVVLVLVSSSSLLSMNPGGTGSNYYPPLFWPGFDQQGKNVRLKKYRMQNKQNNVDAARNALETALVELDRLRQLQNPDAAQLQAAQTRYALAEQHYNTMLKEYGEEMTASYGKLIARGIAGKDWEVVDDANISTLADGIGKGLCYKTSRAVSDVFEEKIRGTINHILGGTWDITLGFVLDSWNSFCSYLFHDSHEPFSESELSEWHTFIIASIEDIEKAVRDSLRESTRGQDLTPRAKTALFDQQASDESEIVTPWLSFVSMYAEQFIYFIEKLEERKEYYDEKHHAHFYIEQIKKQLFNLLQILEAKTVKEVDAKLDSNRYLLTAIKKNIDNLFKRLAQDIKPRTYSVTKNSVNQSKTNGNGKSSSYSQQSDELGFPMSHQAGYF